MSTIQPDPVAEPAPDMDGAGDGRRKRSERSRLHIVAALFALIREGDMHPSAAQVAERAKVGLRTVFRHFEDMDGLYREMTAQLEAQLLPLARQPLQGDTWRDRLDDLVSRRAQVFEELMPIRVAASVRRFQSDYLMQDYERFLSHERRGLVAALDGAIPEGSPQFAALEMVTAFQAWRRMRQDQGLSPHDAEAAMRLAVARLIGD